jgi:hypothetical protein
LSEIFHQQIYLPQGHTSPLDDADQKLEINHQGFIRWNIYGFTILMGCRTTPLITGIVKPTLLTPAIFALIVCLNPPGRHDLPVALTTTKRTAKIAATNIAWIRKKTDPALNTSLQVGPKTGMLPQHRTKPPVIYGNQPTTSTLSIPIRGELKNTLNLNYKKAKSLLVWVISSDMPSLSFDVFSETIDITRAFYCKDKL